MSSIFDLPERVQRLRQMFSYFRNAALLTGADVRSALQAEAGAKAHEEWLSLLSDIRDCACAAEALIVGDGDAVASAGSSQLSEDLREARNQASPASTLH